MHKNKMIIFFTILSLFFIMQLMGETKISNLNFYQSPEKFTYCKDRNEIEFAWIPPGAFYMGQSPGDEDARPNEIPAFVSQVSKGFYMGKYEFTQAQWKKVLQVEKTYTYFPSCGENCPKDSVSWDEIQSLISKLNKIAESENKKYRYRLPTESEWEYAARAGMITRYYWGNEIHPDFLWFSENNEPKGIKPVGQKKPNGFGLYDMLGNIAEWCDDNLVWGQNERHSTKDKNQQFSKENYRKFIRGGSFASTAQETRVSSRSTGDSQYGLKDRGFRLVLYIPDSSKSSPTSSGECE